MGRQLPELDPAMAARIAAMANTTTTTESTETDAVAVEATAAQAIAPDATTPTIATTAGRQAVIDTDAGILGGGVLDGDQLGDVANRDPGALAGDATGPGGAGLLPGFDLGTAFDGSAFSTIDDRLTAGLDGGGTGGGATMGKGMIMDGSLRWETQKGETTVVGGHLVRSDVSVYEDGNGQMWVKAVRYDYDPATNSVTTHTQWSGDGHSASADPGTYETWHAGEDGGTKYEPASDDNAPLWTTGITAQDVTDFVNGLFGSSSSDDGSTSSDSGDGTTPDAGADAGYQTEEQAGAVKPKGWIDADDLLAAFGRVTTSGIVAGSRGGDPAGSSDATGGAPGPMGGDTTVNPGSEGTYADVMASRGAVLGGSAVDWVGQPKPVDAGVKTTVDPNDLQVQMGPDETVINPGTGDGQASTAASSTASSTEGGPTHPTASGGTADDNGTAIHDGASSTMAFAEDPGSPAALQDVLGGDGPDQLHGRDFGHEHGTEHGHGGAPGGGPSDDPGADADGDALMS
jgi:hypothetical protein